MSAMAPQITSLTIVYSAVYSGMIKENIKAPRHWPLWGEFTGDWWFPAQRASKAENVSIWWRHRGGTLFSVVIMNKQLDKCRVSGDFRRHDAQNDTPVTQSPSL